MNDDDNVNFVLTLNQSDRTVRLVLEGPLEGVTSLLAADFAGQVRGRLDGMGMTLN